MKFAKRCKAHFREKRAYGRLDGRCRFRRLATVVTRASNRKKSGPPTHSPQPANHDFSAETTTVTSLYTYDQCDITPPETFERSASVLHDGDVQLKRKAFMSSVVTGTLLRPAQRL